MLTAGTAASDRREMPAFVPPPGPAADLCAQLFDAVDADGVGHLGEAEGKLLLEHCGCPHEDLDAYYSDLISAADADGDGQVSKAEYLAYALEEEELTADADFADAETRDSLSRALAALLEEQRARRAAQELQQPGQPEQRAPPVPPGAAAELCGRLFDAVDVDGSGTLEAAEGKVLLQHCGCPPEDTSATWADLMSAADADGDGKISRGEYLVYSLEEEELTAEGDFLAPEARAELERSLATLLEAQQQQPQPQPQPQQQHPQPQQPKPQQPAGLAPAPAITAPAPAPSVPSAVASQAGEVVELRAALAAEKTAHAETQRAAAAAALGAAATKGRADDLEREVAGLEAELALQTQRAHEQAQEQQLLQQQMQAQLDGQQQEREWLPQQTPPPSPPPAAVHAGASSTLSRSLSAALVAEFSPQRPAAGSPVPGSGSMANSPSVPGGGSPAAYTDYRRHVLGLAGESGRTASVLEGAVGQSARERVYGTLAAGRIGSVQPSEDVVRSTRVLSDKLAALRRGSSDVSSLAPAAMAVAGLGGSSSAATGASGGRGRAGGSGLSTAAVMTSYFTLDDMTATRKSLLTPRS
eukprot:SAG22_NODE_691_length_7888_cov_6.740788_7_plen_586_part_00